jgi:hypothetical protein
MRDVRAGGEGPQALLVEGFAFFWSMHHSPVTVRSSYKDHGHPIQPHPSDPRRVSGDWEDVHCLRQ